MGILQGLEQVKIARASFLDEFIGICKEAGMSRQDVEVFLQTDPFMKIALIDQAAMAAEAQNQIPTLSKNELAFGSHSTRSPMANADYHTAANRAAVANMFAGSSPAELASGRNAMPVKGMLADPAARPAATPPPLPAGAKGSVATEAMRSAGRVAPPPLPAAARSGGAPKLQLSPRPYVPAHATAPRLALRVLPGYR